MIKNVMIIQLMLILVGVIYIYYNYEHREIIYRHQIRSLENQLESADVKINKLKKIIYKYSLRYRWNVTLSGYTTAKDETNKDNTNTAIMEKPIPGWTAAVSHDLKILLGKRVYIQGFGIRYINDLMNSRFQKSVDLLVGSKEYAINKIGKREDIELILIEPFN